MFLLLMALPASANLGGTVFSAWTTTSPSIDGVLSPGEWSDATIVDFTLDMRLRGVDISIEVLDARLYVMNNLGYLYAAVEIFDEDYDAANLGNHYDVFALLFEDDHDHVLVSGDNGEGIEMYVNSPFHTNNDLYYNSSASWHPDAAPPPYGADKTEDGALGWTHTNPVEEATGTYTFEMTIPLVGSDGEAYDLNVVPACAETLGFKIWFHEKDEGMDGVYPDDPTTWPNDLEIEDGTKFGNLVLACPPAVGGTASLIVTPFSESGLLMPLFMLLSVVVVPVVLTFTLFRLRKKTL